VIREVASHTLSWESREGRGIGPNVAPAPAAAKAGASVRTWAGSSRGTASCASWPMQDFEVEQFHPLGIFSAWFVVTEGRRGEGGIGRNSGGELVRVSYAPTESFGMTLEFGRHFARRSAGRALPAVGTFSVREGMPAGHCPRSASTACHLRVIACVSSIRSVALIGPHGGGVSTFVCQGGAARPTVGLAPGKLGAGCCPPVRVND